MGTRIPHCIEQNTSTVYILENVAPNNILIFSHTDQNKHLQYAISIDLVCCKIYIHNEISDTVIPVISDIRYASIKLRRKIIQYMVMGKVNSSSISGASRIRAGQGICVLRQGILGHFRPLLDIFGAKGLFKDTFLFEGRGCIPPPP